MIPLHGHRLRRQPRHYDISGVSPRYGAIDVWVPSLGLGNLGPGEGGNLTQNASGRIVGSPHGELFASTSGAWGFQTASSSASWDACVFVVVETSTSASTYNAGATTSNAVRANPAAIVLRASSSNRLVANVTVEMGDAVGVIGRSSNYRIIHRGVVYTENSNFGHVNFHQIAYNTGRGVQLHCRMPGWGDERLEDLLRITSDPWGELFEPRRIWVPFGAGSATPVTTFASLSAAVQQAQQVTSSIGTAVQSPRNASSTLAAAVRASREAQAELQAAVSAVRAATAGMDAAVSADHSQAATVGGAVQLARSAATALDVAVHAVMQQGTLLSAQVQMESAASATVSAFVQAGANASASLSSAVLHQALAGAGLDGVVLTGRGAAVGASAALQAADDAATVLELAVVLARASSLSVGAQVQAGTSEGATLDVAVSALQTATTGLQIAIARGVSAALSLGAAVMLQRSLSAAMDAVLWGARTQQSNVSAYVLDASIPTLLAGRHRLRMPELGLVNRSVAMPLPAALVRDVTMYPLDP